MVEPLLRPLNRPGKRAVEHVRRALRHAAARSLLFQSGRRLVVAFSGGQDSTCLLHALAHARQDLGIHLIAAHVDHGLRATSAADAERALTLANSMGVEARVCTLDVAGYRAHQFPRSTLQQAARAARYQALAGVVRDVAADALVLAHTADDQAETVLINVLRGTGLAGLAAMRAEDRLDPADLGPPLGGVSNLQPMVVARPLLRIERHTTLAYCEAMRLALVEDLSNSSRAYTRNRVRLDLLPQLEAFNPAVRTVLARLADLAADDDVALHWLVHDLHDRLATSPAADALRYPLAEWRALPRGVQRRLLRFGIDRLAHGLADIPAAPVEDALDLIATAQVRRSYHLPRQIEVLVGQTDFTLARCPASTVQTDAAESGL